jgi:cytochrome c biogenesis protein CcdA
MLKWKYNYKILLLTRRKIMLQTLAFIFTFALIYTVITLNLGALGAVVGQLNFGLIIGALIWIAALNYIKITK